MRNVDILVGLQHGDEGKGRVVDYFAFNYSCVARFNGGPNAGHTVYTASSDEPLKLNMIPSGIVHKNVFNYIGPGCVVDPLSLILEIKRVEDTLGYKIKPSQLGLSEKAHLIIPEYVEKDCKNNSHLGTTKKGIGPCYAAKSDRVGMRVGDVLKKQPYADFLEEYVVGSDDRFLDHLNSGEVLCEGAQGTFLDIDHGPYPYVTSSNTLASHACTSLGFSLHKVRDIFGVFKAYATRVGQDPFFVKWDPESYKSISEIEFGTTTGRQRDIGPISIADLKYSIEVNGVTKLIMTKADVLCGHKFNVLFNGDSINFSYDKCDNSSKFLSYIQFLEFNLGMPIFNISTGPNRLDWLSKI